MNEFYEMGMAAAVEELEKHASTDQIAAKVAGVIPEAFKAKTKELAGRASKFIGEKSKAVTDKAKNVGSKTVEYHKGIGRGLKAGITGKNEHGAVVKGKARWESAKPALKKLIPHGAAVGAIGAEEGIRRSLKD